MQKSYPEKQPNLQPILPTFLLTLLCLLIILFKRDTPKQLKEMLEKRMNLDRCRLEEGFLLLACLQSIKQHNLWQELSTLPCDRNCMVEKVSKELSRAFVTKWGGKECKEYYITDCTINVKIEKGQ